MDEQDFGRKLRVLRHERAETLEDVSAATGLSVAMLSRVERGERLPSPDSVESLARHFGLPAEELMSETIASKMMNRYGRESSSKAAARMQSDDRTMASMSPREAYPETMASAPAPRASASARLPMRAAGMAFIAQPIEALFSEDAARDSLADAARVAEVALESAMRAVRRAQASGDPDQIEEAERVLKRLRRAMG
ncbi:MAG: helix-turn-helix transcriptional regulator [Coriobacteriia bacterium]|nr:helix-turn-helix transcriptional regulator [Coriobacteriia bacterium]